ncbi:type VI secretion system-associated protein TagO [Marinobacter sp. 1-3A]|uniref:type VI secretion system-associated protein VasI n=1 Tax=Marinobacter sp. 1-3A TaxID=2582920 RepID=UPI001903EA49|nr:type VI secretion system-associated protein VasI [Marinobacter sp. 1-3A]MBK1873252.1 type VI secretion system-associated protein TagO [Marinobacter sp. 1-3A]
MKHPNAPTRSSLRPLPLGAVALGLLCFGAASLADVPTQAQADLLEDARGCTSETQRLERLACFDEVFGTPLAEADAATGPNAGVRRMVGSLRWQEAYAQQSAEPSSGSLSYRNTGQTAGLLVTVPALGAKPPRPLLALQCHNNITELTLMLPEPLDAERVNLRLGTTDAAGQGAWRVRDNGYVLSIGRGLPAIRAVKAIEHKTDIRVYSENSRIDGLLFDLTGFETAIRPLRESCGW